LFDLPVAAALIPIGLEGLKSYLRRHKAEFPPAAYRRDMNGRIHRVLDSEDLQRIRLKMLRGPGKQHYSRMSA
jgi:hypothetical protein